MREPKKSLSLIAKGLVICVLFALFSVIPTAYAADKGAEPEPPNSETVDLYYEKSGSGTVLVVDDKQDLMADSEIRSFIESADGVLEYANVAVCTAAEEDYKAYAKHIVDDYFGNGSNSTCFLINMNPRMIYIFSEGSTKQVLTSEVATTITDNVYRQASLGAYYACAEKALSQEATLLSGGHILEPMKYIGNFFLAFMCAILLTFGLTFWLRPKMKKEAIAGISEAVISAMAAGILFSFINEQRIYDPVKSDSGDSGGGGGGGGGGDSGSGGGHSF